MIAPRTLVEKDFLQISDYGPGEKAILSGGDIVEADPTPSLFDRVGWVRSARSGGMTSLLGSFRAGVWIVREGLVRPLNRVANGRWVRSAIMVGES